MEVVVSGSIARGVVRGVSFDAYRTCPPPEALLSTDVFIYFMEFTGTEQSFT
jgi:hypothetical protein